MTKEEKKEKKEKKDIHVMHEENGLGEVQISDEVVATIAGLAATEVEGVASMAGNLTNELIGKLGIKNLSKGVNVLVTDHSVDVDLALHIKYDYSILKVSKDVQARVKNAIESMTGLEVVMVNINIVNVDMEKER